MGLFNWHRWTLLLAAVMAIGAVWLPGCGCSNGGNRELIGKWCAGEEKCLEFLKDGTLIAFGDSVAWKAEDGRIYLYPPNSNADTANYKISGLTLYIMPKNEEDTLELTKVTVTADKKAKPANNEITSPNKTGKLVMGYDQVGWGASVNDVRKAFNLGNEVILRENYENEPDIAELTQKKVSESIAERQFLFNKWNSNGYRLYRVWVTYKTTTNVKEYTQLVQNVKNLLAEKFGEKVDDVYDKYSPELVVELVSSEREQIFTYNNSVRRDIDMSDNRAVTNAFTSGKHYRETQYTLKVCYTWKKLRDLYQARNVGL
jgi:hypothetical protein